MNIPNDISILKSLKLLFFVTAVNTVEGHPDTLLDDIFNNFVAMPYGHVESDVYGSIQKKTITNISVDRRNSRILNPQAILETPQEIQEAINSKISALKLFNKNLIKYSSFDLVEISHKWYSWRKNFELAKKNHAFFHPIKNDEIKQEVKFYF